MAVTGLAVAQDQPQDQGPHPWRSANDADQIQNEPDYQAAPQAAPQSNQDRAPVYRNDDRYPQQRQQNDRYAPPPPNYNVPAHLTIRPGTYLTVRTNQWLSSDRNHAGDSFQATLDQPVIVDGVVVAQRGQTVGGRVTEAQKAGRVEGTSRLGVELIDLTLADGSIVPIQSQMLNRDGRTTEGRDAAAVAGTTALGAAIGASADWGRGAAIGAGAGAAAGILGVLLTRGEPTVIHPESVMTFRVAAPVEVATDRAPQAFRYADGQDYERSEPADMRGPRTAGYNSGYNYGPPPPPAYYPGYGYPGYYPYYRPGLSVYIGPGYYGRYRAYGRFRR